MSKKLLMNNYSENGLMPVMDGLVCWLDGRDGQNGNTVWKDRSRKGNDAELTNCTWTESALRVFSDSDDFLVNKPLINNESFTLEVYFSRIMSERPSAAEKVVSTNTTKTWGGSTAIYIRGNNLFYDAGNNTLNLQFKYNKPCHIAIVNDINKKNRTVYVDGKLVKTSRDTINYVISFLGNWGNEHMRGDIYSVRLYNRTLTTEEVQQNYLYEQSIERG